ncbi:protein abrupt-like [Anopheles nili]|uniref:protein abrupt-like n=1 Tax=Anopheles nili TaxID=185578 RepID=UPI00237AA7CC|nr:protein abrupt-like [Anopheles nili]
MANQQYSLKWNDYTTYISATLDAFRHEEDLVDVTLVCEGRKIRAHKLLLSACSIYFKDIFKENSCQHPTIVFKNVKYIDLLSVVEFMYRGEVSVSEDSLPSFIQTVEMLSVRGLSDINTPSSPMAPINGQPTSTPAQHILPSQNATSAAMATIDGLSNSTVTPQVDMKSHSATNHQLVSKANFKLNDDPGTVGSAIVTQIQSLQRQHQSERSIAVTMAQTPIACQDTRGQANQSPCDLQELVKNAVSTDQSNKTNHSVMENQLPGPAEQLATPDAIQAMTLHTLDIDTSCPPHDQGDEVQMYQPTSKEQEQTLSFAESVPPDNTAVKGKITNFFDVGKGMKQSNDDGDPLPQQEDFEMVEESIGEQHKQDDGTEQNSYEMDAVDIDGISEIKTISKERTIELVEKVKVDKKFKCKECDKSYVNGKSLSMHRQIHSGHTKCIICGTVLSRRANLKRHMKLKHEP